MNGKPSLRQFLKNEIGDYENIDVRWVGGRVPTATFNDKDGNTIKQEQIPDMGADQLIGWFKQYDFDLRQKLVEYSAPLRTAQFKGHRYELFDTPNSFEHAKDFVAGKSSGHILALESKEEMDFIFGEFFDNPSEHRQVWLSASDQAVEGDWRWQSGELKGQVFWMGNHQTGKPLNDLYSAWNMGEPNNANGVNPENCAIALTVKDEQELETLKWNDVPCRHKAALIVEYDGGEHLLQQEL